MTNQAIRRELTQLQQQQKMLEEQVNWMRSVIQSAGFDGPWVSPTLAGLATGRSCDRVMSDIKTAEQWRTERGKPWNLVYGEHYRNDQSSDSYKATWKVNVAKYAEFTKIPPDQLLF